MPKRTAITLTRSRVDRFHFDPAGTQQQYLWDSQVPGLGVQVLPSGRKSWCLRYRIGGKVKRMGMGAVGALSLETARELARAALEQAVQGIDPQVERRRPEPPRPATVADLHRSYIATAYYLSRSVDFRHNFSSTSRCYILPVLGERILSEVSRGEVRGLVEGLVEQGKEGAAQGLLTHLRVLFNYAIEQELITHSPADRIKVKRTSNGRRELWLQSDEDLRHAWWLDAPIQVRALVRWCLLTGCRRDEARMASWAQFDPECTVWTVETTKGGRPLVLPVTEPMLAVLKEMRATFPGSPHCFPATTGPLKPIPRGSTDYILRQATGGAWMWHTLRHTVESHLAELDIGAEVRDLILNHSGRGCVGERYRHGRQIDTKRKALECWHQFLSKVANPQTGQSLTGQLI